MLSILNRALSWAITSFGNKLCLKKRSRLIKALDNRFYVKFMQLEIGILFDLWNKSWLMIAILCRHNEIVGEDLKCCHKAFGNFSKIDSRSG